MAPGDSRYILVADDDPNAIFLLQYAFSVVAPGIRVVYTGDGKQALEYLKNASSAGAGELPAILVLDLKMPHLSGFELLELFQKQPAIRPPCVTIFSCSGQRADREEAARLGADYYYVKPIGLQDLVASVQEMVEVCFGKNLSDAPKKPAAEPQKPSRA